MKENNLFEGRYERKFVIPGYYSHSIENLVQLIDGQFSRIYTPRYINNIYFDSINFKDYYDTIDGISKRKKFRLRWYDDFFGSIREPILECKQKNGIIVQKKSYPFPPFEINSSLNVKTILKNISPTKDNGFIYINNRTASAINRYKRQYFLSKNKKFRITIDTNQQYADPKNIQMPKKLHSLKFQINILELKYDPRWEKEAKNITNALLFRLSKNSKYVNTLRSLYYQIN